MRTKIRDGERLAGLIAEQRGVGARSKLPVHVRRPAIAYAQRRVAQGVSRREVADELGVAPISVARWLSTAPAAKPRRQRSRVPELRRVRVAEPAAAASGGLAVTTLHGLRVEGLALDDVIALIRALG
jgi:hypothetical protein